MLWIAITALFAVAFVTLLIVLGKHSSEDLGSVSTRWIAEHRVDVP